MSTLTITTLSLGGPDSLHRLLYRVPQVFAHGLGCLRPANDRHSHRLVHLVDQGLDVLDQPFLASPAFITASPAFITASPAFIIASLAFIIHESPPQGMVIRHYT